MSQVKAERSRALRYKKAMLDEINIESINDFLWEAMEECSNIAFSWDDENILEALDGNEEDAFEFKMLFSDLERDCEQLQSCLSETYVNEYFNDFFVGLAYKGNVPYKMLGYDSFEEDYFALVGYEEELASTESGKRVKRLTKDDMISVSGQCFGIVLLYLNIRYKYDYLKATFDVLKGENGAILKTVKDIENLYESMFKTGYFSEYSPETKEFNRLLESVPERLWIE